MILRSQLRMNKNIMFPFISCILIMLTLLVLIHKSVDKLNVVNKELLLCKQKQELANSQLQIAIEDKLQLEKSLEKERSEKTKEIKQVDEMRSKLDQEQENRRKEKEDLKKEKEDVDVRYEDLKQQLKSAQNENKELKTENIRLGAQLEQVHLEKDKEIENLQDKVKILKNMLPISKTFNDNKPPPAPIQEHVDLVRPMKGAMTPSVNQQALAGREESARQVAPPPNNQVEDKKHESLDAKVGDDLKMDENVLNPPLLKSDSKNNGGDALPADDAGRDGGDENPSKNLQSQSNANMPIPYLRANKEVSASYKGVEHPVEEQAANLPAPVLKPPSDKKEKVHGEMALNDKQGEQMEGDDDDNYNEKDLEERNGA